MRGGTVQINWHDTKPVLTLDFHPPSGILATGGADFDIKLWLVSPGEVQKKNPTASYQNSLAYHSSAVNALRFSPSGKYLALLCQIGYCTLVEFENDELGSLITLSGKKAVGDESWSPVLKSEDTPMVEVTMNKGIISADGEKAEAVENEGKQRSASPVITPIQNKPAKRRITPMAID